MGARYQDGRIGRFISQDPVFQAIGDNQKIKEKTKLDLQKLLEDPQGLNSYSYARNNPIKMVDQTGEWFQDYLFKGQSWNDFSIEVGQATQQLTQDSKAWNFAVSNPYVAGPLVGALSIPALTTGETALATLVHGALAEGVSTAYTANKLVESGLYAYLSQESIRKSIPEIMKKLGSINTNNPSMKDISSLTTSLGMKFLPGATGEVTSATMDIFGMAKSVVDSLVKDKNSKKNINNK